MPELVGPGDLEVPGPPAPALAALGLQQRVLAHQALAPGHRIPHRRSVNPLPGSRPVTTSILLYPHSASFSTKSTKTHPTTRSFTEDDVRLSKLVPLCL